MIAPPPAPCLRSPTASLLPLILLLSLGMSLGAALASPVPADRPARPFRFRQVTFPLIDPVRVGTPRIATGHLSCNPRLTPGGCPVRDAVLATTQVSGIQDPGAWQPDALFLGGPNGLRLDHHRLYPPGLPLTDPRTLFQFGNSAGACLGDLDGDGWSELVVVNRQGPHRLWRNQGEGRFRDATSELHQQDGDGQELAVVLEQLIRDPAAAAGQRGTAYSRQRLRLGEAPDPAWPPWRLYTDPYHTLARGCSLADLDGDGLDELIVFHTGVITARMLSGTPPEYLVQPARSVQLFRNGRDGRPGVFTDVTWDTWLTLPEPLDRRGVASLLPVELDGDGPPALVLGCAAEGHAPCRSAVLRRQADGSYRESQTLPGPAAVVALETALIEGRRLLFFVYRHGPPGLYQVQAGRLEQLEPSSRDAGGASPTAAQAAEAFAASGADLGDPDGDGRPELVIAGSQGVQLYASPPPPAPFRLVRDTARWPGLRALQDRPPEDVAWLDVNGDGRFELLAARTGFSRIVTPDATAEELASPMTNMDRGGSAADVDGDGRADLLTPGFRTFAADPAAQRELRDQVLLGTDLPGRFRDVSDRLPQPKLDNLRQCQQEGRGSDPFCDRPARCRQRCAAACDQDAQDREDCEAGCSQTQLWTRLHQADLRRGRELLCPAPRVAAVAGPPRPPYLSGLQAAARSWSTPLTELCRGPATVALGEPRWQRLFETLHRQAGPGGPVAKGWGWDRIEESVDLQPLQLGPRRYLFLQHRFVPPELYEVLPGGRFVPVEPARLPCEARPGRLPVSVADVNGDGVTDLVVPAVGDGAQLELWLGQLEAPDGRLFRRERLAVTYSAAPRKLYGLYPFPVTTGPAAGWSRFVALITEGALLLEPMPDHTYRASPLREPAGRAWVPRCRDPQATGTTLGPCPGPRAPGTWQSVATGDVDGDRLADLLLLASPTSGEVAHAASLHATPVRTRVSSLLLSRLTDQGLRFENATEQLFYDLFSGRNGRFQDPRAPMRTMAATVADLDLDGDQDLLLVDFHSPLYLENQGASCWSTRQPHCLRDRTPEVFGGAAAFDGVYGAKNYGGDVADFNGDGRPDFYLRTAAENLLYLQE